MIGTGARPALRQADRRDRKGSSRIHSENSNVELHGRSGKQEGSSLRDDENHPQQARFIHVSSQRAIALKSEQRGTMATTERPGLLD